MQSKKWTLLEVSVGLISGLLISIFIVQPIVFMYYGISLGVGQNTSIAIIFTVVSFIRGYITRRIFNYIHTRRKKNDIQR